MLVAQALGEYGAMSGLVSAFGTFWSMTENTIRQTQPATWVFIGIGLFLFWFLLVRR